MLEKRRMNDDKVRRGLKLKTFDEIRNDSIYEISLFSRKRRDEEQVTN